MKAFSSVSSTFITPLYPEMGQGITVKIAFSEKVERVVLRYDSYTGLMEDSEMHLIKEEKNTYYYQGKAKVFHSTEDFSYFFIIFTKEGPYYYSNDGLSIYPPRFLSRFIIKPAMDAPSWVSGVNCYQIFPDRFCNGDRTNDVKSGEYEFDGALVQAKEFDSIPEDFEQSHCLDFYNGDLKGVEEKLDYLKDLGISMIYLNPLFDSRTVHRYDAVDFFNIDKKLGGNEALISLVEKAHQKGIKVLLDISINHVGTESEWYKNALKGGDERKFFIREKDGSLKFWQGINTLATLNYSSYALRDLIYRSYGSVMQKFIRPPFNIDGWRLDVAPEVARIKEGSLCLELWRDIRKRLKSVKNDIYLVGEGWDDSYKYLEGDMWDATMNYYGSGRILRMMLGEEDRFLQRGWGYDPTSRKRLSAKEAANAFNQAIKGQYDQMRHFQMNLIDSHDTPRLHNNDKIMDDSRYLGLKMILYFLPGFPSLYYGDEIKLDGRITSVEGCRYPMNWNEETQNKEYYEWFKSLAKIRQKKGFGDSAYSIEEDNGVFIIKRFLHSETIVGLFNQEDDERNLSLDPFMLASSKGSLILGSAEISGLDVKIEGGRAAVLSFKKR